MAAVGKMFRLIKVQVLFSSFANRVEHLPFQLTQERGVLPPVKPQSLFRDASSPSPLMDLLFQHTRVLWLLLSRWRWACVPGLTRKSRDLTSSITVKSATTTRKPQARNIGDAPC